MARIREFRGLRPRKDLAHRVATLPYDVVSSGEARQIAKNNPYSFFHVTKPEIDLPEGIEPYDGLVYASGRSSLDSFIRQGVLSIDPEPRLYAYTLFMEGRAQTGLAACVHIDDYLGSVIRKHELTREDKELDRSRHLDALGAQAGPVFLLYREGGAKKSLFERVLGFPTEYDFTAEDGIRHVLRVVDEEDLIKSFRAAFENDTLYIADGHHRAASAVRVGLERRKANPGHDGSEEYNWFLAVIFPHDQLRILPYNRVVRDLNGLTEGEFFEKLAGRFIIEKSARKSPRRLHEFCMYAGGQWHTLVPREVDDGDFLGSLDVNILQRELLEPILSITDPRTDRRIDFVGGIRGTEELEKLVDSGAHRAAFSLFPTSVEQLIRVSDAGSIMPPKSTWFEPKLRSGLVVHLIER